MGLFIRVETLADRCAGMACGKCVPVCPVRIFVADGACVAVDPEQEDECTLCDLCLQSCPEDAIVIHRLYRRPTTPGGSLGRRVGALEHGDQAFQMPGSN